MSSLGMFLAAADTAAPFHSECPEKFDDSIPALSRSSFIFSMMYDRLNGPSVRENKGWSGSLGWAWNSVVRALTGQRIELARER